MGRRPVRLGRRELLVALAGASVGCATADRPATTGGTSPSRASATTVAGDGAGAGGVELPVPVSDLERAVPRDFIPAITDPSFDRDWSGVELTVRDLQGGADDTTGAGRQ